MLSGFEQYPRWAPLIQTKQATKRGGVLDRYLGIGHD